MKGWYAVNDPTTGRSVEEAWGNVGWGFLAGYLDVRFGDRWCLAPEASIALHLGDWSLPSQLTVRAAQGGNKPTRLPAGRRLVDLRLAVATDDVERCAGLRVYRLAAALVACPAEQFRAQPRQLGAALALLEDPETLVARLVGGGHSRVGGRLAGALRNVGRLDVADAIVTALRAAGHRVREEDPFEGPQPSRLLGRAPSPYANPVWLRRWWAQHRQTVLDSMAAAGRRPADTAMPTATGPSAAAVLRRDHLIWYQSLRGQSPPGQLRQHGYRRFSRRHRGAAHTPPRHESLGALMPALFDLLDGEPEPAVRAVLGSLVIHYLEPFGDRDETIAHQALALLLAEAAPPAAVAGAAGSTAARADPALIERAIVDGEVAPYAAWVARQLPFTAPVAAAPAEPPQGSPIYSDSGEQDH